VTGHIIAIALLGHGMVTYFSWLTPGVHGRAFGTLPDSSLGHCMAIVWPAIPLAPV